MSTGPAPAAVRRLLRRAMWLSTVRPLICRSRHMHLASSCLLNTRTGSAGELREQLELQAADMHRGASDGDGLGDQVDVDRTGLQVAHRGLLQDPPHDGCDDGAQQDVTCAGWEVVVAAALVGTQRRELVAGAERDHRQRWMHARMPARAHGPHQRRRLKGPLELAQDQHVNRVSGQLRDDCRSAVGLIDGVPVAIELAGEERALPVVCAGDQQGVLCCGLGVLQGMNRHVVSCRLRSAVRARACGPGRVGLCRSGLAGP